MPNKKITAIVLLVVGAGLMFWGYQMSEAVGSQIMKTFTGSFSDGIMLRFIAGAACIAVGLYLVKK